MPFNSIAFVEEPPEFDYRDGHFHIRQRFTSECIIERVMSPRTFFESIARAVECSRLHRIGGAEIVQLHAASSDRSSQSAG